MTELTSSIILKVRGPFSNLMHLNQIYIPGMTSSITATGMMRMLIGLRSWNQRQINWTGLNALNIDSVAVFVNISLYYSSLNGLTHSEL